MSVVGWLLLPALGLLGFYSLKLIENTGLLRQGVAAQGVVVGEQSISCGKSGTRNTVSVQFTDRTGQTYTSIFSQCEYDIDASPGESITILYLPNDPGVIAPYDGVIFNVKFYLLGTILFGLIALLLLFLLFLWIRERIRKRSLPPEVDAGSYSTATRWREQINEETPQGVGGEDAVESGTSEIAPTMSQLLSGVQRVSERIDSMIANAARSREALHWAGVLQLLEVIRNNPRNIEYITKLARATRDLQGILQLHQKMLDRAAENNRLLHSLISEASCGGEEPVRNNGYTSD